MQTQTTQVNEVQAKADAGWECVRDNATRLQKEAEKLAAKIPANEPERDRLVWSIHTMMMIRFIKEMSTVLAMGLADAEARRNAN